MITSEKNGIWSVSYIWFTWPRWSCYQPISFNNEYLWCNFKFHSMFGIWDLSGGWTLPKLLWIWLEPVSVKGQFSCNYFFQEPVLKERSGWLLALVSLQDFLLLPMWNIKKKKKPFNNIFDAKYISIIIFGYIHIWINIDKRFSNA